MIPTIIRLAQLMAVADPQKKYKILLSDKEELEVQILAFRDLVNERHFPIFNYYEDEEHFGEVMDMWASGWIDRTYHPLLNKIPVRPLGFADHDIDPSDYCASHPLGGRGSSGAAVLVSQYTTRDAKV